MAVILLRVLSHRDISFSCNKLIVIKKMTDLLKNNADIGGKKSWLRTRTEVSR